MSDYQRHEWETFCREQERQGRCPHGGCKFAVCKATICDCFDYDYEARIQRWERVKLWWDLSATSPRNWPRMAAWRLWRRRQHQQWIDTLVLPDDEDREEPF